MSAPCSFSRLLHWCGSTQAFPFGEGGFFNVHIWTLKKTEEVLPQYEFAESYSENNTLYRTSPAPCGGTLPKGEGFVCTLMGNHELPLFFDFCGAQSQELLVGIHDAHGVVVLQFQHVTGGILAQAHVRDLL